MQPVHPNYNLEIDDMTKPTAVTPYYPTLTPEVERFLKVVPKLLATNTDYLYHEACPYPDVVLIERAFNVATEGGTSNEFFDSEQFKDREIDLEEEAQSMYWEIKQFKTNLDKSDVSEKVQLFRLATTLLEKLLVIKEKATGITQFVAFQQIILDTMERYLTPVQLSEFAQKMDDLFGGSD